MKTTTHRSSAQLFQSAIILLFTFSFFLILPDVNAQIPQNIQVDGESSDVVSYIYYGLALVVFVVLILILGKFFRKKE